MVSRTMSLRINSSLENVRRFTKSKETELDLEGYNTKNLTENLMRTLNNLPMERNKPGPITRGFHLEVPF